MKKAYVTPVMESEAFVANEYVAACYRIRCTGGEEGYVDLAHEPTYDWNDGDKDGFGSTVTGPEEYYTGVINGKDPHEKHYYLWKGEVNPIQSNIRNSGAMIDDGSISFIDISESDSGAIVQMIGNSVDKGKGATWATFYSEFVEIQEFQFKYEINKGDSFNSGGFMFNVEETDTALEGYLLSINFKNEFWDKAQSNGAIYKVRYIKGANTENFEYLELISPLQFGNYTSKRESSGAGTISIEVLNEKDGTSGYKITGSELHEPYILNLQPSEIKPNTFGFYSDHYDHHCMQIGYFKLDDIKILVVRSK